VADSGQPVHPGPVGQGVVMTVCDWQPIVLVILDGLGDRPLPELDGLTPSEAAHTPHLDALVTRGATGWHQPFGLGRATSSERSHWAMFGFDTVPFPGRAVIEALGCGLDVTYGSAVMHGALRMGVVDDTGVCRITGRAGFADATDVSVLMPVVTDVAAQFGVDVAALDIPGEMVLTFHDAPCADVTDSDPFFDATHPYMQVLPFHDTSHPAEAAALASRTNQFLLAVHHALATHPANTARVAAGRQPINVLTTKWPGVRREIPTFQQQVGIAGGAVTGTRLYRGLVKLLDMAQIDTRPGDDLAAHMTFSVDGARQLIADGAQFVHLHTKATDEAGHTKDPYAKRDVIEAIDAGLDGLLTLLDTAVVCVTGDHATPSSASVLHTADPTPFVVAGPSLHTDTVTRFGETFMQGGRFGRVAATDVLPVLLEAANRPAFFGHRPSAFNTLALPTNPAPFQFDR
jgi:2,3-bisphosphoglycerate-independent phosphoglycerate mutase